MSRWPEVALGEVLTQYREYIDVPQPREYLKLSVRLYGKGVVLDAPADGTTLKMKRHQLAKPGQVILSEIWGKKGAIGFVPPEGTGALCTSHFFLFDVDRSKLDPGWLQVTTSTRVGQSRAPMQPTFSSSTRFSRQRERSRGNLTLLTAISSA